MDRIVVFMNGERGLAVLHALCTARHGVMHVFVPAGCTADDEIARTCHGLGVSLKAVENVNTPNFIARLTRLKPTVSIIAGYSTIFKRHLLKVPELGTINLHAGRLPDYRGGSPLNWQIINGESEAGISVIRVDEGIDTGCVLAEARIPIALGDTIADLHQRANEVFPRLVLEVVDRFRRGDLSGRMQDGLRACHWHQRNEADGRIRFDRMTAKQVHNLVRAITNPYPGAFAFLDGRKVRILETLLSDEVIRGVPGRVFWLQGRGPFVICANRAILLQDYRVESEDVDELEHGAHLD